MYDILTKKHQIIKFLKTSNGIYYLRIAEQTVKFMKQ